MFGWVLMRSVQQLVVQSQDTQPPAISVIVPARNEAHNIVLLIEELRQQIRTTDEIVVVDDGSTDNTLQLAQGSASGGVGRESTRLLGWSRSSTE
jgi:cellulose synthase/poly-beta-1,6-N-acetylglucosamine synthase-like glycosyltransferase